MKRKKPSVVPAKNAEVRTEVAGKTMIVPHKAAKRGKCVICGGVVAPFSLEALCWVCRRLKISAWRESENQPSMQD